RIESPGGGHGRADVAARHRGRHQIEPRVGGFPKEAPGERGGRRGDEEQGGPASGLHAAPGKNGIARPRAPLSSRPASSSSSSPEWSAPSKSRAARARVL